jgi:hypothetical protein
MNTVISGVPVTVYEEGIIKINNEVVVPLYDADNYSKVCIGTCYYKVQNIIASLFLEYDLSEKDRFVTHIDNNPLNNHVNNLKIERMGSKRKLENLSLD